ncbi:MAG: hypothetical protein KDK51_06300 [Deltaproteobacteria bacterium]|nr:hypothetical protein [Deltaproteobacteria bacterium]
MKKTALISATCLLFLLGVFDVQAQESGCYVYLKIVDQEHDVLAGIPIRTTQGDLVGVTDMDGLIALPAGGQYVMGKNGQKQDLWRPNEQLVIGDENFIRTRFTVANGKCGEENKTVRTLLKVACIVNIYLVDEKNTGTEGNISPPSLAQGVVFVSAQKGETLVSTDGYIEALKVSALTTSFHLSSMDYTFKRYRFEGCQEVNPMEVYIPVQRREPK